MERGQRDLLHGPSLPPEVLRHLGAVLRVEAGAVTPGGDGPRGVHDRLLETEELPGGRAEIGAGAEIGGQAGGVQHGGGHALAVDGVERCHGVPHGDQACGEAAHLGEVAPPALGLVVGHHVPHHGAGGGLGEDGGQLVARRTELGDGPAWPVVVVPDQRHDPPHALDRLRRRDGYAVRGVLRREERLTEGLLQVGGVLRPLEQGRRIVERGPQPFEPRPVVTALLEPGRQSAGASHGVHDEIRVQCLRVTVALVTAEVADGAHGVVVVPQSGGPAAENGHVGQGRDAFAEQGLQQGAPDREHVAARAVQRLRCAVEVGEPLGRRQGRAVVPGFRRDPREPPLRPRVACREEHVEVLVLGYSGTRRVPRGDVVGLDDDDPVCAVGQHTRRQKPRDAAAEHTCRVEQHGYVTGRSGVNKLLKKGDHGLGHRACPRPKRYGMRMLTDNLQGLNALTPHVRHGSGIGCDPNFGRCADLGVARVDSVARQGSCEGGALTACRWRPGRGWRKPSAPARSSRGPGGPFSRGLPRSAGGGPARRAGRAVRLRPRAGPR